MPDVTVAASKVAAHSVTLAANQVSTISFTDNISAVDVISDGAAPVYYTVDGSTPTIGGANCYLIPAGLTGIDTRDTTNSAGAGTLDVVKVISTCVPGAPIVSVQRGD